MNRSSDEHPFFPFPLGSNSKAYWGRDAWCTNWAFAQMLGISVWRIQRLTGSLPVLYARYERTRRECRVYRFRDVLAAYLEDQASGSARHDLSVYRHPLAPPLPPEPDPRMKKSGWYPTANGGRRPSPRKGDSIFSQGNIYYLNVWRGLRPRSPRKPP